MPFKDVIKSPFYPWSLSKSVESLLKSVESYYLYNHEKTDLHFTHRRKPAFGASANHAF